MAEDKHEKKAQREDILEWLELRKQVKERYEQYKQMTAEPEELIRRLHDEYKVDTEEAEKRIRNLETNLIAQLKELEEQSFRVDQIIAFVKSRKSTSVKYKPLFEKAMSMVNAKVRRILEGMSSKEPFRTEKTKHTLETKEAPIVEARLYDPIFHGRMGRIGSVLEGRIHKSFINDTDPLIRTFAILASEDLNVLRRLAMLDDSELCKQAAILRISRLAPELVATLKETQYAKYAQTDELWQDLHELRLMIDIFESLMEEEL